MSYYFTSSCSYLRFNSYTSKIRMQDFVLILKIAYMKYWCLYFILISLHKLKQNTNTLMKKIMRKIDLVSRILGRAKHKNIRRNASRETENKWGLQANPDTTSLTSVESHFVSTQSLPPALASYVILHK